MTYTKEQREEMSRRVKRGLDKAIRRGRKLGRPKTIDYKKLYELAAPLRNKGISYDAIGRALGANGATVFRAFKKPNFKVLCEFCNQWFVKKSEYSKSRVCSFTCFKGQRLLSRTFLSLGREQNLFFELEDLSENSKEFIASPQFRYLRIMGKYKKARMEFNQKRRLENEQQDNTPESIDSANGSVSARENQQPHQPD